MLDDDRALAQKLGFNPYCRKRDAGLADMASNDYLGIARHPLVLAGAKAALDEYGASMCGTPIACGSSELSDAVARRLAEFAGVADAALFPSCYQANNGVFQALCGEGDLIVFDRFCHSSLVQGIFASPAERTPFRHNDLAHLEAVLSRQSARRGRVFVATESVFSTEGAVAPLDGIAALCARFGATPVVDDSHGIGVLGAGGRGALERFGLRGNFDGGILTASLGKALASSGGMVGADSATIERLRYYCPHLIYSTAISPPALGAVAGALDVICAEFAERSARLRGYKQILQEASPRMARTEAPINSLFCGTKEKAVLDAKAFFESGIAVTPFVEPSVPRGKCVVRLIANAGLAPEAVDAAVRVLKNLE